MKSEFPKAFAPLRQERMDDPWRPLYFRKHRRAIFLGLRAGPGHAFTWLRSRA